jgi:hypothetical protein
VTQSAEPVITPAEVEAIAAILRSDAKKSLQSACIMAGCGDRYPAIRRSYNRAKRGDASAERVELMSPVVSAVAEQCEALLIKAEGLAGEGKSASFYQWWLAKKDRVEYGDHTKHEIVGLDDGPVQTEDVSKLGDEELIKRWLMVNPAQQGGGG